MIVRRNAALAAIAALCLPFGQVAFAQPVLGRDREAVVARIKTADLDLATATGRKRLEQRVRTAAAALCVSRLGGFDGEMDSDRCRSEMIADATVKIAALQDRGAGVRVASAH